MRLFCRILAIIFVSLSSLLACDESDNNPSTIISEYDIQKIKEQLGATKIINSYDDEDCFVYRVEPSSGSTKATINQSVTHDKVKEGSGALNIKYTFVGGGKTPAYESVFLEQHWTDYRLDLSFHPLGLSLWVKGRAGNKGSLRIMIIQNDKMFTSAAATASRDNWQYFEYTDNQILAKDEWQELIIPYNYFKLYKGNAGADRLDLSRFMGYRIEVVNDSNTEGMGEFEIDKLEQLTSYKPEYGKPKLSSLFIQLNDVYKNENWDVAFSACKEVGIDSWIIQYSHGFVGTEPGIVWYSGSEAAWVTKEYSIMDQMFKAAERQNFKLIVGLYGGDYNGPSTADPAQYTLLAERNKFVLDELYNKFASSPAFAGWYITEEFHDGDLGWQYDPALSYLAQYLQNVASYAKSKEKKFPVQIAPALFRGMPADLCAGWFDKIFQQTPDIDYLYLQDIAGRCLVDVDVDLPNYYEQIKKVCDKNGVAFGVDIESFLSCNCAHIPYRAKTWNELEEQLYVAGLFTDHITNFSWATFKPGLNSFEGYKNYLNNK